MLKLLEHLSESIFVNGKKELMESFEPFMLGKKNRIQTNRKGATSTYEVGSVFGLSRFWPKFESWPNALNEIINCQLQH